MDIDNLWEVTKVSLAPPKMQNRSVVLAPSMGLAWKSTTGIICTYGRPLPDSPLALSPAPHNGPTVTAWKNTLWMVVNHKRSRSYKNRDGVLIFRPSPRGDKTTANQWIGPFMAPERDRITDLWTDRAGHVWITTGSNLYRVDAEQLVSSELAIAQTRTRKQWRDEYHKRLDSGNWRCRVRACVLTRQWSQAVKILDTERKSLGTVTAASDAVKKGDHADLLMWRAIVMSNKPDWEPRAIRLYEQIIADPLVDRTARRDARRGLIVSLCTSGDHAGALKRVEEYYRLYPPRGGVSSDLKLEHMEYMIRKARKAMSRKK